MALHPIAYSSKSLTSAEIRYRNIEGELLGILHSLKKFPHYCFTWEVNMITDDKPLVAIFKDDVATLSQRLWQILLHICQDRIRFLYKSGLQLYIVSWLSRHCHTEGTDKESTGMNLNINAVETDIPECIMAKEMRHAMHADDLLSTLTVYVINA